MNTNSCNNSINIKVNTKELEPRQVRVLKSIVSTITHVMKTNNESDYFNASSELMKLVASVVKDANFNEKNTDIEYSMQALEYCVDNLLEHIHAEEVIRYDN